MYFGDDQQHIRHEVEGFFRNYLYFNASAFDGLVSEDKKAELRAKGFGFYASGVVEQFRTMTYDQVLYRVERSIAMSLQELSLLYSEQILEFLAPGPSVQEILAFRPRLEIKEQFSQLLAANRHRALTAQNEELDHCIRIECMMALLKAKAYHRFDRLPWYDLHGWRGIFVRCIHQQLFRLPGSLPLPTPYAFGLVWCDLPMLRARLTVLWPLASPLSQSPP